MNTKTTFAELMTAARHFEDIREDIRKAIVTLNPVELVTPKGINDIKAAWIENAKKGIFENPTWEYDLDQLNYAISCRKGLKKLQSALESVRPNKDDIAKQFVWEQLRLALVDALNTTYLAGTIKNGNDEGSATCVDLKYGAPGVSITSKALDIVLDNSAKGSLSTKVTKNFALNKENDAILKEKIDAEGIKKLFQWAMEQYPARPWPIEIKDNVTAIDVRDKSSLGHPVIMIPTTREVTGYKLAELIGHEIECHWRSSVNAELIGVLKYDDELVYEGLAVSKDIAFNRGYLGKFEMNSAYRIVAMREALAGHPFSKVAKLIYDYLPESVKNRKAKAWMHTYRVFRGITNPENRGLYAFTKDRAYFEGCLYASELVKQGKECYLSFSTLSREALESLIKITDIADIATHVVVDRNIQHLALDKIIQYQKYKNTQAANLVAKV